MPKLFIFQCLFVNLTLDVTYECTGRSRSNAIWLKGIHVLVRKIQDGIVMTFENRSHIKGQASLILASTTIMDKGTYTVRLGANDVEKVIRIRSHCYLGM